MGKKVSIITPTYNSEKYIGKLINSVKNQTYKNWEFIIIDDHSNDNTPIILKKFQEEYPDKVILLKTPKPKSGPSIGRNIGINNMTGDYVVFIDSDDWWDLKFLDDTIIKMKQKIDAVTTGYFDIFESTNQIIKVPPSKTGIITWRDILKFKARFGPGNTLLRSDIIREYNIKFNEKYKYSEDLHFFIQYLSVTENIYSIKNPEFFHLIRSNSLVRSKSDPNEKITQTIKVYDDLCKRVLPQLTTRYNDICKLIYNYVRPYSIMNYIITSLDTCGRKKAIKMFIENINYLLYYKPSLSRQSLLTLLWMIDVFIPIRKPIKYIFTKIKNE